MMRCSTASNRKGHAKMSDFSRFGMSRGLCLRLLIVQILWLTSCGEFGSTGKGDAALLVFAAAGTRTATEEICDQYEKSGNRSVSRNYASSGTLARQIAAGATADVFISANRQWIDFLKDKGLLKAGSIHKIAGNALVVVAPKNRMTAIPRFERRFDIAASIADKIVIGDPSYVPVGKYTKAAFDTLGWFDKIRDKMILAKDVSSVLSYVALGEVDWGVVYRSEAIASDRVTIVATIPGMLHPPIEFFIADVTHQRSETRALSEMFRSNSGLATFLRHGFSETRLVSTDTKNAR
jgi:molybdate transport system substrate-binding protein